MKFRLMKIALLLSIAVFGLTPVLVAAQTPTATDADLKLDIISLTNTDRTAHSVGLLKENSLLTQAAQQKANDMLARQYFSHVAPDGGTPWQWFRANGYTYLYAGENLAMNFYTAGDVETAWMNSPTHRANVLNGTYKNIGIGIARGTYQGQSVIIIVEFFGTQQTVVKAKSKPSVTLAAIR